MKKEEANIYRAIQKNAEMAVEAIDTISDKVFDDSLALQLAREGLKYSDIRNRAVDRLLQGKAEPYRARPFSVLMLKAGIHLNTMFNTGTSYIAELMIRGSNHGIVAICRTLNQYPGQKSHATEMANEFVDFEERNIARLKRYL